MARSFHSSTASNLTPSMSSSESQNSNRDPELDILEDENEIFGDDDRNVLVQCDHLQMQSKMFVTNQNFFSKSRNDNRIRIY